MDAASSAPGASPDLDLSKYPNAQKLVDRCAEFFAEVEDLTPGKDLEARLNSTYGPGTPHYDSFRQLILEGLKKDEGWVASHPISLSEDEQKQGIEYRRGRICGPSEKTRFFSITTVYMSCPKGGSEREFFSGQYHAHPYGEINCVIQVDSDDAELEGMSGWQGAGWTSPGPGTHHYPRVRNGGLVALFFLPAGRISYKAVPGTAQPHCI